ncbi:MAG: benzoate/H(+) symporter BenE family transporter [Gemmobacter sp.]
MRLSMISAALVAALAGYGSSIAIVLAAAAAVDASAAETASWVLALCLTKAAGSALLSAWTRTPVVLAWSTPGAALIAASSGMTLAEAAGAFLLAGALVLATGAIRPLERAVAAIPDGVAAGMLAGVLLPFVMELARAVPEGWGYVLPVTLAFAAVRLIAPTLAVLGALAAGVAAAALAPGLPAVPLALSPLVPVWPTFRPEVLLGLGLPLFLVTMAAQNLPGFAVLRAAGYTAPVRPALMVTGGLSMLGALAGAHGINMAAITAAICLDPGVEPDRDRRWRVGLAYAAIWVLLGLAGGALVALMLGLPGAVVAAVVGLALIGPLAGALGAAFGPAEGRFAAAVTLAVTASGVAAFGIGAAFWGLAAGLTAHALDRSGVRR